MKHPLDYTKEDLADIMHVPLQIGVGSNNLHEIKEVLEGKLVDCTLAVNPPHLPAIAEFITIKGEIRKLTFFEIKWINKL